MRGVVEHYKKEFADVEEMVKELGPKGTVEAFLKAFEYFEANKENTPEEQRAKPMTAEEWKQVLQEDYDDLEDEEEEEAWSDLEGEEEEDGFLEEGEEELDGEDGEEGQEEPPSKKQKT